MIFNETSQLYIGDNKEMKKKKEKKKKKRNRIFIILCDFLHGM